MDLLGQRGAQPITLDGRRRVCLFDMAATWLLVQKYGLDFATHLYSIGSHDSAVANIELKSINALHFFLWAGLQADAREHKEVLELGDIEPFMRPWLLPQIFNAVFLALVGNTYVPEPKGKDEAASPAAQPAAPKVAGKKKVSTLTMRSGLLMHRSAGK